jgi:3-isopropylmalate dehydrogenase
MMVEGDDGRVKAVKLGVLVGDGIGHEIVPAAQRVVECALGAAGAGDVEWVALPFGRAAIDSHGTPIPDETLSALGNLSGWILGPHDNASYPHEMRGVAPGGVIRKHFDLFANIRPARAMTGVRAVAPDLDVVIVRENTEGFYADRNMFTGSGEFMPTPDVAMAVAVVTRQACERVAHAACRLAARRSGHVTVVHKANVLALTTGLFLDTCRAVAANYPGVRIDDQHVDAMAALLVRRGRDFDVVVTENMFGDILSDLAAELAGSLGIAASINSSERQAMAQAAHGAAPDIAGRNRANPTALILSAALLLEWLASKEASKEKAHALHAAAQRIRRAVADTIGSGVATADLGGLASTSEFTEHVLARAARRG